MDEYLRFENTIFCSSNCNCLRFSAHSLSLLLISLLFIFNNVLTAVNTTIKYLLPKFHVMFKFNYSKYNPRGLISGGGGVRHGRSFPFQKLVPKRPRVYTRWGLLSYGMRCFSYWMKSRKINWKNDLHSYNRWGLDLYSKSKYKSRR